MPGSLACDLCGAVLDPEARPGASREERRLVTILFADLVGFTGLGERLDPEDLRSVQQTYFDAASRVIRRRHGVVEKYIGDAVMAVFGAPVSQEDDAVRAVRAGLELQAALDRQVEGRGGPMRVRIGIATGEVVVDLDAVRDRGQALVAGDVVNIAARLQQHAPPGGVLVSAATWRMTLDHVEYTGTDPITVKGKTASLAVWQAQRMVQRRWDDHPDRGPFLGREPELERLTEALRVAIDTGEPQLACLVGAPGIGKSRLAREFNRHADHTLPAAARWMGGRCLPSGEGGVFAALADVVSAHADLRESDPADVARRKLQASLHGLFSGAEQARMVEALAPLVGVEAARVEADESGSAWRLFLQRLAAQRPLVLVIEDLHWAEQPLLDFLDALVPPRPDCPLLVVGTLRPEFGAGRKPWPGPGPGRTVIPLAPLGEHHTGTLFRSLAGDQTIPEPVLRKLAGLAGGTPLYAHEYVRMLADTGALADADNDDGLPLPDSVHAVVAGRIDLLDRVTQRALQAAAVVGEVFWPGAVEAVADLPRDQVVVLLTELRRREFLRAATDGGFADQPALRFDHAVVRDAVYRRQPRALRLIRHQRAAAWLESRSPDRATDVVDAIAHHRVAVLTLAGTLSLDPAPFRAAARAALVAAAERAAALHAVPQAIALLDEALDLVPAGADESPADAVARITATVHRWRLRFLLDEHAFYAADGPTHAADCARVLDHLGAPEPAAAAWTLVGQSEWMRGNRSTALTCLDRALAVFADATDSPAKAAVHAELARLRMVNYETEPAIEAARAASAMAERLGLAELSANAQITEGGARYLGGDPAGLSLLERAVERCRTDQLRSFRRASQNLASALLEEGEIARSLALLREVSAQFVGDAAAAVPNFCDESTHAYYGGDWERTIAAADEFVRRSDHERASSEVLALRAQNAWLRTLRGAPPCEDLDECLELARQGGFRLTVATVLAHGALCSALVDDRDQAHRYLAGLETEYTAEAFASREWLAAAAHAASLTSADHARWLRGVLDAVPRETLWVRAARAVVDGGLADHDGNHGTAALRYGVAASVYDRMGNASDGALAATWAVRASHAAGDPAASRGVARRLADFAVRNHAPMLLRLAKEIPPVQSSSRPASIA